MRIRGTDHPLRRQRSDNCRPSPLGPLRLDSVAVPWWASAITPHQGGSGRVGHDLSALVVMTGPVRRQSTDIEWRLWLSMAGAIRFAWECPSQGVALGQGMPGRLVLAQPESVQGWQRAALIGIQISKSQRFSARITDEA